MDTAVGLICRRNHKANTRHKATVNGEKIMGGERLYSCHIVFYFTLGSGQYSEVGN